MCSLMNKVIHRNVPSTRFTSSTYPVWYIGPLIFKTKQKFKKWKLNKNTQNDSNRLQFDRLREELTVDNQNAYKSSAKCELKIFWDFKNYKRHTSIRPSFLLLNDKFIDDSQSMAECFGNPFASIFNCVLGNSNYR